jgi:hypothetical protein
MAHVVEADGVDLDYEEFWHADTFKTVAKTAYVGMLPRTKGKILRIMAVWKYYTQMYGLGFSFPTPAVGTILGPWYFGNMKGLFVKDTPDGYATYPLDYPDVAATALLSASNLMDPAIYWNQLTGTNFTLSEILDGGVCPMIYDLGGGAINKTAASECGGGKSDAQTVGNPQQMPTDCDLTNQVKFYFKQWHNTVKKNLYLGYEVGRPAFPSQSLRKGQLNINGDLTIPLTKQTVTDLSTGLGESGVFYWDIFKGTADYTKSNTCCADHLGGEPVKCPPQEDQATGDYIANTYCRKYSPNFDCPTVNTTSICQYNTCGCDIATCINDAPMTGSKCGQTNKDGDNYQVGL